MINKVNTKTVFAGKDNHHELAFIIRIGSVSKTENKYARRKK